MSIKYDPVTGEPIMPPPAKPLVFKEKDLSDEEIAKYLPHNRPEEFKGKYEADILFDPKNNSTYLIHISPKATDGEAATDPLDVVYKYDEKNREVFVTTLSVKELKAYIEGHLFVAADNHYWHLEKDDYPDRFENVMWFFDTDLFDSDEENPWNNPYYDHEGDVDDFFTFCEECERCRKIHQNNKKKCTLDKQQLCATLWAARRFASK